MKTIFLTHQLVPKAIEILEKRAKVIIGNTADLMSVQSKIIKADAIINRLGEVSGELIEKCPNLRVVMRAGVGTDNFDIPACTKRGIAVAICPGGNLRSVAEHAVALGYMLAKKIYESVEEAKKGNFAIRNRFAAAELEGHTLGVVGFGAIGRETAKLFEANGMKVLVYDPFVSKEAIESYGFSYIVDLKELLAVSELLTLHLPSNAQTKGMFSKSEFDAAKEGMYLINCARGDIIDEEALYNALVSGKLGGAATDVMSVEPFNLENPLFSLPNFIATPHMAGLTKEAAERTHIMAANNIFALLEGEELSCVVNKEVFDTDEWKAYKANL